MKKLEKFDDALERIQLFVSGLGFMIMVTAVTLNVFARFIVMKSFAWTEEISYLFFVWSVFFAVCILYRHQALIAIDAVVDRLPLRAQHSVSIFTFGLVFVINIVLAFLSFKLAIGAWVRPTPILRIPYFFVDIAPALAFVQLSYYSFKFFVMSIRGEEIGTATLEDRA